MEYDLEQQESFEALTSRFARTSFMEKKSKAETNLSPNISLRITVLRFPLIVGIIMFHAYGVSVRFADNVTGSSDVHQLALFSQELISHVFARVALPLFFLFTGFVFFRNFEFKWTTLIHKYRNRLFSLFIPYVLWNSATLIFYLIVTSIPSLSHYFNGTGMSKFVAHYTFYNYVDAYVGLNHFPIDYQLWFIRDIMILAILSPLVGLITHRGSTLALLLIAGLWFMRTNDSFTILSYKSILFYYLGALIAVKKYSLDWVDLHGGKVLITYFFLAFIEAVLRIHYLPILPYLHKIVLLPGVISAWYLAGKMAIQPSINKKISILSGYTFFVYAAHEPLLSGLQKVSYRVFAPSETFSITFLYFLCPMMTIAITLLTAYCLRVHFTRFYNLITGGRT